MTRPLSGRGILLTGANRGLGLAIGRACVAAGGDILITVRQPEQLAESLAALEAVRCESTQTISGTLCDLSSTEAMDAAVARAVVELPAFTGLVNNAGVYGPKGRLESADWKAWTDAISVNLLGTAYMMRATVPHFRTAKYGKVVNLSGGGATAPLPMISAYAASKAAVVRLTETVAHEVHADGIFVNALAPGALNTGMLDEVIAAGPELVGETFFDRALKQRSSGGTPLDVGAQCVVWLLSAASDGMTGRLISAVWDPWPTLGNHAGEIATTDIYTLRRIVPKDRGLTWGDP